MNGGEYGRKISLERKAGGQKYSGKHVEEVCRHARKYGASQAMLIYDSRANLPSEFPPIKVLFRPQQKLTIAVACLDERSWVTAREILEVLQIVTPPDEKTENSIDLTGLDKAIADIHAVNAIIDKLRKTNNAALRNCEGTRTCIEELEGSILSYQNRLRKILEKEIVEVISVDR
jgi:nucleotidyltransferase/DNA polymerase involved in DNA repair